MNAEQKMPRNFEIPDSVDFSDLAVERKGPGAPLLFVPYPLERVAHSNGLNASSILADEDLSCWLICEWYVAHRQAGGEPDPIVEHLLSEVRDIQESGIASLQPGSGVPN